MYSQDELSSLYGFLRNTGEGNLKKMLVSGQMTDAHLRILLKVVRQSSEAEFVDHFQNGTLPKVKLSGTEIPLKETFWSVCTEPFLSVGLLTKQTKAA